MVVTEQTRTSSKMLQTLKDKASKKSILASVSDEVELRSKTPRRSTCPRVRRRFDGVNLFVVAISIYLFRLHVRSVRRG